MKTFYKLFSAGVLATALFTTGCDKQKETVKPSTLTNSQNNTIAPIEPEQGCGTASFCTLYAGRTNPSGTVFVYNDADHLYVKYVSTAGTFGTLHLWAGTSLSLMPATQDIKRGPNAGPGNPIPGQFPYVSGVGDYSSASGTSNYIFKIPLSEIRNYNPDAPTPIIVVAHAEIGNETAFGGCTSVNIDKGDNGRWYYHMSHTVQACDGTVTTPSLMKLGSAFAYGDFVFSSDPKSVPAGMTSLDLSRNRWGWANKIVAGQTINAPLWAGAGLNKTSSGIQVGTVDITYDGLDVKVKYTLRRGYSIEEAHVYAADATPTTIAPGQYGNPYYFRSPFATVTDEYSYRVIDADGVRGVWVIAHAVAYGLIPSTL